MNPVFPKGEPLLEWQSPTWENWSSRWKWRWPNDFRKLMFGIFLASVFASIVNLGRAYYTAHEYSLLRNIFVGPLHSVFFGTITGVAAWAIWRADPSARGWAILASLLNVLLFLRHFLFTVRNAPWDPNNWMELCVGLLGVACFTWPDKPDSSTAHGVNS